MKKVIALAALGVIALSTSAYASGRHGLTIADCIALGLPLTYVGSYPPDEAAVTLPPLKDFTPTPDVSFVIPPPAIDHLPPFVLPPAWLFNPDAAMPPGLATHTPTAPMPAVPIPGALPLFASALGIAWWVRRKCA